MNVVLTLNTSVSAFFRFHRNHHTDLPLISVLFQLLLLMVGIDQLLALKNTEKMHFSQAELDYQGAALLPTRTSTIFLQQGVHSNSDQPWMKRPGILHITTQSIECSLSIATHFVESRRCIMQPKRCSSKQKSAARMGDKKSCYRCPLVFQWIEWAEELSNTHIMIFITLKCLNNPVLVFSFN